MEINPDTQPGQLLSLIALSGEYPYSNIDRIAGGNEYIKKTLYKLRQDKLIKKHLKDHIAGYRLTVKTKKLLLAQNPERFQFYLTGSVSTNISKSEISRRLRLHRIAEAYTMMSNAGISIFRDEKPNIFAPPANAGKSGCSANDAFYDSREIKELERENIKIKNSRAVGVLVTGTYLYAVYNTGSSLMRWETRTEEKFSEMVRFHFLRKSGFCPEISAIMIGAQLGTALAILESGGGYNHSYLMIDETYERLYFIPNDTIGEFLLRLLCNTDLKEQTYALLMTDLKPAKQRFVDCDAVDEKGNLILFGFDFDLVRIKRFCSGLKLRHMSGTIICFDFQSDVLRQFCDTSIFIQTIDLQKFRSKFKIQ